VDSTDAANGIGECEQFENGLDEENIGFTWNKYSQYLLAINSTDPTGEDPCMVRTTSVCRDEEGTPSQCKYPNQFLFAKNERDGIDLGEWDIQLGVKIEDQDPSNVSQKTLKQCAEDAAEDDSQTGFAYKFTDDPEMNTGMCMPLLEGETHSWAIPFYNSNNSDESYYPGAVFLKSQLDYHIITEPGVRCEDLDMDYVYSTVDCKAAAEALGLEVQGGDVNENTEDVNRPSGCYWVSNYMTNATKNELWMKQDQFDSSRRGSQLWRADADRKSRLQICKKNR
jgi:hypothetical protein